MISFSPPDITEAEITEVAEAMRSGWITTGPRTKKLEAGLAKFCGTKKVCCLNSATSSLELILRILGVKSGDEVITSAYTYTATCSVICHVGATPILVDVEKDSYQLNLNQVSDAITERTKVIIPVDIGGTMCDYDKLFEIVEDKKKLFRSDSSIQKVFNRIIIVSDGAHALGSTYKGLRCGEIADFTTFSLVVLKNKTRKEYTGIRSEGSKAA